MKKSYIKPNIGIIAFENHVMLVQNSMSEEPQVTGNIGSREFDSDFDWDDDVNNSWEEDIE